MSREIENISAGAEGKGRIFYDNIKPGVTVKCGNARRIFI